MKRHFNRLAALVAAAVAVSAVAVTAAQTRPQASVKLTFWQTMNEQETVTLKQLVNRFEQTHSNIEIEVVYVPFDQRDAKFTAAAQAGKAPDVMRAEIADVANWAAQGFLADLSKKVSAADKADYLPAAFAYDQFAGKIWGVPQVTDALALFYNKRLFKAAKAKVPTSMAQLTSTCRKFGKGKGIFLRADSYWTQPWIWAAGGDLLNYPKKQILIATKASIAGLASYNSLFRDTCAFPDKDFANDYGNAMTAFKNGDVAMIVNGPWSTADVLSGDEFKSSSNFGLAPIPAGAGGKQGSPVGGHSYVIGRNSKNVDEAYTFIQWMSQSAQQAVLAAKNNLLPTRKSAYALPEVKKNRIIVDFLGVMKRAKARPVIPQGGQIYTDFGTNVQKMLNGQSSPAKAADAIAKAWVSKLFPGFKIVK
jgi:arabinogalactan oligomer/maltooligosaccharide transport system substrate-binding protein